MRTPQRPEVLERIGRRFMPFVKSYSHHFYVYRKDLSDKARQYTSGLMQAGSRKNMGRMAEVVPDCRSRNLQQFINHSNLSEREVIDHVAADADALLGDREKTAFVIDESDFKNERRVENPRK